MSLKDDTNFLFLRWFHWEIINKFYMKCTIIEVPDTKSKLQALTSMMLMIIVVIVVVG